MLYLALEGVVRAILAISFSFFLKYMNWAPRDEVMLIAYTTTFTHLMVSLLGAKLTFLNDFAEKNK